MLLNVAAGLASVGDAVRPSPLPDGVAIYLRAFFGLPPRVVIPAAAIAILATTVMLGLAWRRRSNVARWWISRWQDRAWRVGVVAGASSVVVGAASVATVSWNYMQHDNGFCISCHVMSDAWQRFGTSEHRSLQCHDCHRQSIYASARQLAIWFTRRPTDIGTHQPISKERCVACHVTGEPTPWRSIAVSAGHRRHLDAQDTLLKNVTCLTCHGAKVHEFVASEKTCLSVGCHEGTRFKLGKMQALPIHCAACHDFNRTLVASGAQLHDSLERALWPRKEQCLSCHAMRAKLAGSLDRDPHKAVCGSCHDPHSQRSSAAAAERCATAGCHERADTLSGMHVGLRAGKLGDCVACHSAHTFKVEAEHCKSCHGVPTGSRRFTILAENGRSSDASFAHAPHAQAACNSCHATDGSHGRLLLRRAADCQSCHHASVSAQRCTSCHRDVELRNRAFAVTQVIRIARASPRARTMRFQHRVHPGVACTSCHRDARGQFANGRDVSCAGCHDDHHRAAAQCAACHDRPARDIHPLSVHREGCTGSECHAASLQLPKPPFAKTICLACHEAGFKHKSGRRCIDCHDVRDPVARAPVGSSRKPGRML